MNIPYWSKGVLTPIGYNMKNAEFLIFSDFVFNFFSTCDILEKINYYNT